MVCESSSTTIKNGNRLGNIALMNNSKEELTAIVLVDWKNTNSTVNIIIIIVKKKLKDIV